METTVTNRMFHTLRKLRNAINDIQDYRYRDRIFLQDLKICEDQTKEGVPTLPKGPWETAKIGDHWVGRDKYLWLTFDMTLPKSWEGKKLYCFFDFGLTGGGTTNGFESLAYLNGKPYQGVDSNHKEVFLPRELVGQKLDLILRLWTGLEGGGNPREMDHQFKQASFGWLDEVVDDLYFTGLAVLDTIDQLPETDSNHVKLIALIDRAIIHIDWTQVHNQDAFYDSLYEAQRILRESIEKLEKHSDITVNCVGHTHIDVAWLWRLKHSREKSVRSFSTVLRLMELFPDYKFLQTQPRLYDYIKLDYPEVYEQIKTRVAEGRWDASGAMWVEADCNIPSGESLVRQILYGKKFFKTEFNKESDFLWLPDVFGYSWALPQILLKSGVKTFITSKISWNQYNKIPHDTFMWKGIDGSEILTHMITTPEINQNKDSWFFTYNGNIHANTVNETWNRYVDKDINQELILPFGHGDGGGGVERKMLEMRRRLDELPGLPNVKTQTVSEYVERLNETIEKTDRYVHEWDGELYLEYHRGTYTSQAKIKKYNRVIENLYRKAELVGVLSIVANKQGGVYNKEALDKGWHIILTNQFHDILPGSSINEVYQDAMKDFKIAESIAENFIEDNLNALLKKATNIYSILNDSNWVRNDIVEIESSTEGHFLDNKGKILESQKTKSGYLVYLENMQPIAFKTIHFVPKKQESTSSVFEIKNNKIETPFYSVELDEHGHFTRIFDKEVKRDILAKGSIGNVIQTFEDRPMNWDAWDIDLFYQNKKYDVNDLVNMTVVEQGNLRAILRLEWKHLHSTITQDIIFYAFSKRIDFHTNVDWQERRHLMKVAFPVDIRTTKATYDIQYGNVERPNHWNTSWDYARFEVLGHKWADLSDGGYGVSLLNDCKYGYDIKGNIMRLTLLKSATYPDPVADLGTHEFTYSLYPHQGDWRIGETEQVAFNLNHQLNLVAGLVQEQSLVKLSEKNVEVDAVKKAENSDYIIVRLHEYKGMKSTVSLQSDFQILQFAECDLMENVMGEFVNDSVITFTINPYEIKTFMIKLK
ncbi:MAG: alpha-mannosidase [Bacillales bacterium]|nr:alpha-mannosidase [Bacillales bacterium]